MQYEEVERQRQLVDNVNALPVPESEKKELLTQLSSIQNDVAELEAIKAGKAKAPHVQIYSDKQGYRLETGYRPTGIRKETAPKKVPTKVVNRPREAHGKGSGRKTSASLSKTGLKSEPDPEPEPRPAPKAASTGTPNLSNRFRAAAAQARAAQQPSPLETECLQKLAAKVVQLRDYNQQLEEKYPKLRMSTGQQRLVAFLKEVDAKLSQAPGYHSRADGPSMASAMGFAKNAAEYPEAMLEVLSYAPGGIGMAAAYGQTLYNVATGQTSAEQASAELATSFNPRTRLAKNMAKLGRNAEQTQVASKTAPRASTNIPTPATSSASSSAAVGKMADNAIKTAANTAKAASNVSKAAKVEKVSLNLQALNLEGDVAKGMSRIRKSAEQVKLGKDQPWNIRPGQEWKQKIVGKAQRTGTTGHVFESYKEAIRAAKQGDTAQVFLNRGYHKATGVPIKSNRRPDVLVVKKDGKVYATEIQSKSDKERILLQRNEEAMNKLPKHMQGKVKIVPANKDIQ